MVSFLKKMLQENHPHLDMKIMENIPDFQETIENREIWRKVGYFKGNSRTTQVEHAFTRFVAKQ